MAVPSLATVKQAFFQSHWSLQFVEEYSGLLQHLGVYEQFLLDAYTGVKVNHRRVPESTLRMLFFFADVGKCRQYGQPFPDPLPATLSRGVSGHGRSRRPRSYSWTSDLACASWFALRWHLPDPVIYQVPCEPGLVYAYLSDLQEEEYLLCPWMLPRLRRVSLTLEEMAAQQQQHVAARQARDEARRARRVVLKAAAAPV